MRHKFLIISSFFIVLAATFFYLFLVWRVSSTLAEQTLYQEEIAAKVGSKSISLFVENLGFQISVFATRISIVSPDPVNTPNALKNFVNGMEETPLTGIMLADSQGNVLYGFERQGRFGNGEDVSGREYFKWAKGAKAGDVFIGDPITSILGLSKGQYIVPLATPVIKGGQFGGVLVAPFFVESLTTKYMDQLKINSNTRVYLIDENGTIIVSPFENLLSTNYFDYIERLNVKADVLRLALASKKSGTIDMELPDETKEGALTRFLIGYAPIEVEKTHWLLAIATPASNALASLAPLNFRDLGIIGLVFSVSLTIAFYLDKMLEILKRKPKGQRKTLRLKIVKKS